jgi:hypothetical protein
MNLSSICRLSPVFISVAWTLFSVSASVCQSKTAPAVTTDAKAYSTEELRQALALHKAIVASVSESDDALDAKLPGELLERYPEKMTTKMITAKGASNGEHRRALTKSEAIKRTETILEESGLVTNVAIVASPGKCNVEYRPVVGGSRLSAGATDLTTTLAPKWYVFSCDCANPPLQQRVDCTVNRTVAFSCPAGRKKTKQ